MDKSEAVVLRVYPAGEADGLVVCYSKNHGVIRARARGVRKSGAKLAGGLQRFNWIDLYFVRGRSLPIITDVHIKDSFREIKLNPEKMRAADNALSFVERVIPDHLLERGSSSRPVDTLTWVLLVNYLRSLAAHNDTATLSVFPTVFRYQLFSTHGIRPELEQCVFCGEPYDSEKSYVFSYAAGGIVDVLCDYKDPGAVPMDPTVRELFLFWDKHPFDAAVARTVPAATLAPLIEIVSRFSAWHFGETAIA